MKAFDYYQLMAFHSFSSLIAGACMLFAGVAGGQSSFLPYHPEEGKEVRANPPLSSPQAVPEVLAPVAKGNHVQQVLQSIMETAPELVGQIPENSRYYLIRAHASVVSEDQLKQLQEAFYLDVTATCQFYARMYLLDWKVLVAKSARETFWGASFLCNRTNNYFGIWLKNKSWICSTFGFCGTLTRNDPAPADFAFFPSFEKSLWMFIHTIYSFHYRERLPDQGERIYGAIGFERTYGVNYWKENHYGDYYIDHLEGPVYHMNHLIYSWSEHEEGFNLCIECTRESDKKWVFQVMQTEYRLSKSAKEEAGTGGQTDAIRMMVAGSDVEQPRNKEPE